MSSLSILSSSSLIITIFCEGLSYSTKTWWFLKAIYKTRNTGTGNGMRGTRGMFTRIPGNLLEDSGECYYFNIPGNVEEDSGECSERFRGTFEEIPGNVPEDYGECSRKFRRRFRGMFERIPGNLNLDLFCEILLIILSNSAIKLRKNKGIFSALLITT